MLNNIIIMGRLTRDPELRATQSQKPVASFTVAVDRDYSASGEKQTDFIDCVAWDKTADFVSKWFKKGNMIVAQGRLQFRSWLDKEDKSHNRAEVNVDRVWFGEGAKKSEETAQKFDEDPGDGTLPF